MQFCKRYQIVLEVPSLTIVYYLKIADIQNFKKLTTLISWKIQKQAKKWKEKNKLKLSIILRKKYYLKNIFE